MRRRPSHRRVAVSLVCAALLHILVFWLIDLFIPPEVQQQFFRARLVVRPKLKPKRFEPRRAISIPRQILERMREEVVPLYPKAESLEMKLEALPVSEQPLAEEFLPLRWEKGKGRWETQLDTVDIDLDIATHEAELPEMDAVQLGAERRRYNVILIDRETGKLKEAYLHLPAYRGPGANRLEKLLRALKYGESLSGKMPLIYEVDVCKSYPQRHILHYSEMKEYSVLLLEYINVESTESLVRYLMEGGFAVVNSGQIQVLRREIQRKVGDRLQAIKIGLEHPLFHTYYDITEYTSPKGFPKCPLVKPVYGLEFDGRLIAVTGVPFTSGKPCIINELYVNILVYGLIQPSKMGGRYVVR